MRQRARGSLAVLSGAILSVGLIGGAMAASGEGEMDAIYGFRKLLVDGLRQSKSELQEYRASIAQYIEDHPGAFDVLSTQPGRVGAVRRGSAQPARRNTARCRSPARGKSPSSSAPSRRECAGYLVGVG